MDESIQAKNKKKCFINESEYILYNIYLNLILFEKLVDEFGILIER